MEQILIKNANLVNIPYKTICKTDVQISDGIVSAMGTGLPKTTDTYVIHGDDLFLTAGWIDAHAHMDQSNGKIGIDPDDQLKNGVTLMVEAGTCGTDGFGDFLKNYVNCKKMPIKVLVNLAPTGIGGEELKDLSQIDLDKCINTIEKYRANIIGLKLRIDPRCCSDGIEALRLVRRLGDKTALPFTVHASRSTESLENILSCMRAGDVFAHTYADMPPGLLDDTGKVKVAAWEARNRGVFFDLSHGYSNFSYSVAKQAFRQGFLPNAISTDLHFGSLPKLKSLALTMTKAMHCGLDFYTTLDLVTARAANMLGIHDKAVEVTIGSKADMVLFRLTEGMFPLNDSNGATEIVTHKFEPCYTILGNTVYTPDR